MPFYYDVSQALTSNGTPLTETDHLRLLTISQQATCSLTALYGTLQGTTAGGAALRLKTFATASTVGGAVTPAKRHPNSPAAQVTAFSAPTAGATPTVRVTVGLAQTGGNGGWVATEPSSAVSLLANGGANGNADVFSIAAAASQPGNFTLELNEA